MVHIFLLHWLRVLDEQVVQNHLLIHRVVLIYQKFENQLEFDGKNALAILVASQLLIDLGHFAHYSLTHFLSIVCHHYWYRGRGCVTSCVVKEKP